MPILKCEFCGKTFSRNNYQIKKAKHHFCSNECRYNSQIIINPFIEHEDYIEILCENLGIMQSVLIDKDDYLKFITHNVQAYKKDSDKTFYAKHHGKFLHRIITNCPADMVVDHINHNGLDNRKENLRICTVKNNTRNRKCYKTNGSKTLGVTWDKKLQKWKVTLQYNGKSLHGGYFLDIEQAISKRRKMELAYFQDFAYKKEVENA